MEIIPAIDIINGKCVRLTEGNYDAKTEYAASPLEMAKQYASCGFRRVHLVDLDGAKAGKVVNWNVAKEIATHTDLSIDFGGGVKTVEEVNQILNLGIDYVTVGSIAAKQPDVFRTWLQTFGTDKFLLGADVLDKKIMTDGWLEKTDMDIFEFLHDYVQLGVKNIFCTDISKDGKLMGPSLQLYTEIIERFPGIHFIASGGVSSMEDLHQLRAIGCSGAIVGKAIYEGRITLDALASFNQQSN
ncbi:MAG: 1-(5-phosphoribosyl)-5-[(5-phosphoribosylamino)methylideneamino]imidazole-4-carboxamide isomerase [Bacteroidota bacterium]|jgi:phosphoribosylformimino-5-aminoimidazole carboxamide ribotide isomerase